MTIVEFNLLSEQEQDESVTDHGIYAMNYLQGDLMCDIYKLYEFMVKYCYHVNDDSSPTITAFASNKEFILFQDKLSPH